MNDATYWIALAALALALFALRKVQSIEARLLPGAVRSGPRAT